MSKQWDDNNMATVSCRVRRNDAELFNDFAKRNRTTAHALLSTYIKEAVAADSTLSVTAASLIRAQVEANDNLRQENANLKHQLKETKESLERTLDRAKHAEDLVEYMKAN